MTDTPAYDFAAALDALDEYDQYGKFIPFFARINIRLSLKLAAKVFPEPSEGACDAAWRKVHPDDYEEIFTAMISQACLEVENGN